MNKNKFITKYIFTGIFVLISLVLYFLTLRGNLGVPSANDIDLKLSSSGKAFETSQERSRYAMILSLINDHTFSIDNYASMGTPDVGAIKGHYYSFFPPGASVLAIPLYLVGLKIGATQMMTFLISTIFAFMTLLLIIKFARKLNLHWSTALFSALAFGFATNAWGYSVTFYAHLISGFFLLSGLYFTVIDHKNKKLTSLLIWLLYAAAVYMDFPNLFIFLPIALIHFFSGFSAEKIQNKFKFSLKWYLIFTPILFVSLMGAYGYYNYVHFGKPTTLSNDLPRVRDLKTFSQSIPETGKDAAGALNTRNSLNGYYSFLISQDRGILIYSPVALLFLLGLGVIGKKLSKRALLGLVAVPATCLALYTMFGDPYGGWAFGSRYLIAVLPELCILAGVTLEGFAHSKLKSIVVKFVFTVVFLYSSAVSLLAPLTTNVIPPKVEATSLGLAYDYRINIAMLNQNSLNSFFYNNYANRFIDGWQYYGIIYALVGMAGIILIWVNKKGENNENV